MTIDLYSLQGNSARVYQLDREARRMVDRNPDLKKRTKEWEALPNPRGAELFDIDNESWVDYLLSKPIFSHMEKEKFLEDIRKQSIGYKCKKCGEIIVLNFTSTMTYCECFNLGVDSNPYYCRVSFRDGEDSVEEIMTLTNKQNRVKTLEKELSGLLVLRDREQEELDVFYSEEVDNDRTAEIESSLQEIESEIIKVQENIDELLIAIDESDELTLGQMEQKEDYKLDRDTFFGE